MSAEITIKTGLNLPMEVRREPKSVSESVEGAISGFPSVRESKNLNGWWRRGDSVARGGRIGAPQGFAGIFCPLSGRWEGEGSHFG